MEQNARMKDLVTREEFEQLKKSIYKQSKDISRWTDMCAKKVNSIKSAQSDIEDNIKRLSELAEKDSRELLNIRRQHNIINKRLKDLEFFSRNMTENVNSLERKMR